MDYQETLQYLYKQLPVFHIVGGSAYKPGLENTEKLMDALGQPHQKYRTIHVGGTNGKGSVSHFLSAILQSAGYKVGLYTSPHLVDFGERIKVDGQKIEQSFVVDFVEQNKSSFENIKPSFFEATMAMAFSYFEQCEVDVAIIEVGLGGRLDSTNIILPEISIITNISFDHTEYLGDTISKIATEKAGIIKPGIPVVIGESQSESEIIFRNKALQMQSEIYFADKEYKLEIIDTQLEKIKVKVNASTEYLVGLTGTYQLKNIATVLKSIEILSDKFPKINASSIQEGLNKIVELTGLMGRWQCFGSLPSFYMDTAHNYAGVFELVNHIKYQQYKSLHLVFGMVKDKDISNILQILPINAKYYFTNAHIERALPAKELKHMAEKYHLMGDSYDSVSEAVMSAESCADTTDLLIVFGSNFVVGEAIDYKFSHNKA